LELDHPHPSAEAAELAVWRNFPVNEQIVGLRGWSFQVLMADERCRVAGEVDSILDAAGASSPTLSGRCDGLVPAGDVAARRAIGEADEQEAPTRPAKFFGGGPR
jgi:hypothetical protein